MLNFEARGTKAMQGTMELKMNMATMIQAVQEFFDNHMPDIHATVSAVEQESKTTSYTSGDFKIVFCCPTQSPQESFT